MTCTATNCLNDADGELFHISTHTNQIFAYGYCLKHYTNRLWADNNWSTTRYYFKTRAEAEAELVSRILLHASMS